MDKTHQPWPDEWPQQPHGDFRKKQQKPQWDIVRSEAIQAHRQAYPAPNNKVDVMLPQSQMVQPVPRQVPSYNLIADVQNRQLQQEQQVLAQMQHQLSTIAQRYQLRWQEHCEAIVNAKDLFERILDELPDFCDSLNGLLVPSFPITEMVPPTSGPPKLFWRVDGDRSIAILDVMGVTISILFYEQPQPMMLSRVGRSPLLCSRVIAMQGDMLDIHSPLYSQELTELLPYELASLYIGADPNAPVIMRLISDNPAQVSEEVFFYPQQTPRAFLTKLLDRLGQCLLFHETTL